MFYKTWMIYLIRVFNGGGMHVGGDFGRADISGSSTITNNIAANYGGGIWTSRYENLSVTNTVRFSGNRANAPHDHGAENRSLLGNVLPQYAGGGYGGNPQNINWRTVSIPGTHALNNFDVNYTGIPEIELPQIYIRKELRMPYGTTVPNATFDFNIELVSVFPALTTLPAITIPNPSVTFNSGMTAVPHPEYSGYVYVYTYIPINITANMFPAPGVFRFRVTEEAGSSSFNTNPDDTMEYDPAMFYLYVYVGRPGGIMTDPLQIIGYYAWRRTPGPLCDACEEDDDCDTCQYDMLEKNPVIMPFRNRFSRRPDPASFDVRKIVTGHMGNPSLPFNFTVTLELPDSVPLPADIGVTITGYARDENGQILIPLNRVTVPDSTTTINATTRVVTYTFTLRHEDIITFSNLPVDTTYVVIEHFTAGYDQTGVATIGGVAGSTISAINMYPYHLLIPGVVSPPANDSVPFTNIVTVTNAHDGTPPTGVFLSNMPFGLMVALGAGALALTATAVIVGSKVKAKK